MALNDTFGLADMEKELIRDEGLILHVYKDPGSGFAIGVGRNITTQGVSAKERAELGITDEHLVEGGIPITREQAMGLLITDITDRAHQLDVKQPWWRTLTPARQRVLINMAHQMGTTGMGKKQWLAVSMLRKGQYTDFGAALLGTQWGKKYINRAERHIAQVEKG